jgi:hypothetical protein
VEAISREINSRPRDERRPTEVVVEGYLRSGDPAPRVPYVNGDQVRIFIHDQPSGSSNWVPIDVKKGTQPNQIEPVMSGDEVSSFRLHTNDGGIAAIGDKITVDVRITPIPNDNKCFLDVLKIKKE